MVKISRLCFWNIMAERGPTLSALRAVMGRILSAVISSGNEIGELQKGKLVEFRV